MNGGNLLVKNINIEELKPFPDNPRNITYKEYEKLRKSIQEFGLVVPLVVDEDNVVIGGNQRLNAIKSLGYREVPCVVVSGLSETKKKALNIALNKISGEWDREKLLEILNNLETSVDFGLTGFDVIEYQQLKPQEIIEIEEWPVEEKKVKEIKPKIKSGEIVNLGPNKLICGDSSNIENWKRLFGDRKFRLLITSPPYNKDIKYCKYKDNKELVEYIDLIEKVFTNARNFEEHYAVYVINLPGYTTNNNVDITSYVSVTFMKLGLLYAGKIIWEKPKFQGRGRATNTISYIPRSYTEDLILYSNDKGCADYISELLVYRNFEKLKFYKTETVPEYIISKYAGNIWKINANSNSSIHPAQFPPQLVYVASYMFCNKDDIVCDPFSGVGNTMIGANKRGCSAYMIEIDERYSTYIIDRWERS